MARVRPFRAYTYARTSPDISDLVAPPYDVISEEQRARLLARNPRNVVALELPEGPLDPSLRGNRYETGGKRWAEWVAEGVVTQDRVPALYVLEQKYRWSDREVRRRAFITETALEPFDAGVILPHERTLPKALGDRYNLIEATAANFSQVFGLFADPDRASDALFDRATSGEPALLATDDEGVESRVWAVTDPSLGDELASLMADKQIFIADGHHRYTTALAYRDARREADESIGASPPDPDYDWLMIALVNMDDPDLVVLPTHRVADAVGQFDTESFYSSMRRYFDVAQLGPGHPSGVLDGHERPAFLVRTRGEARPRLAVLRADVDLDIAIPLERSHAWKELDVAVLQELVLGPLLGIHPDRPDTLERLAFVKDVHQALEAINDHDVAFILRPTRMDQMRAVSLAGDMMPQKSTYFYPKLLSGLVLRGMT